MSSRVTCGRRRVGLLARSSHFGLLAPLSLPRAAAIQTSAAPATSSTTTTITYGTHDQLPLNVRRRSRVCSSRRAPIARKQTPVPMSTAPASPNADVAAETLERVDRLLLRVRDDEVFQLADRLLRVVGHSAPVGSARGVSPRRRGCTRRNGVRARARVRLGSAASGYAPTSARDLVLQARRRAAREVAVGDEREAQVLGRRRRRRRARRRRRCARSSRAEPGERVADEAGRERAGAPGDASPRRSPRSAGRAASSSAPSSASHVTRLRARGRTRRAASTPAVGTPSRGQRRRVIDLRCPAAVVPVASPAPARARASSSSAV